MSQFIIVMPLTALITDADAKVHDVVPQVSAIHLTAATVQEALSAALIFTTPETILSQAGRGFLQTSSIDENLTAVFVDEFHIVRTWYVSLLLFMNMTVCSCRKIMVNIY